MNRQNYLVLGLSVAVCLLGYRLGLAREDWANRIPETWIWDIPKIEETPPADSFPGAGAICLYDIDFFSAKKSYSLRLGCIKIFNQDGFKQAEIESPAYAKGDSLVVWARMRKPDGSIVDLPPAEFKVKVALSSGFLEKNWLIKIFTFPQLQPGCIIQYQFLQQRARFTTHKFFQRPIPMRLCELASVEQREVVNYVALPSGAMGYSSKKLESDPSYFIHTWSKQNVPAFVSEPLAPPYKEIADRLIIEQPDPFLQYFKSGIIKRVYGKTEVRSAPTGNTKKIVKSAVGSITDTLKMIRAVYYHVQQNFPAPRGRFGYWIFDDIEAILKAKDRAQPDVNFIFYSLMRTLGVEAALVLVSAQSQFVQKQVAPIEDIDNMIVRVRFKGDEFYCDPAAMVPFSILTPQDQGHYGFVFNQDNIDWFFLPGMKKENNQIINKVKAQLDDKLVLKADVECMLKGNSAGEFLRDSARWQGEKLKELISDKLKQFHAGVKIDSVAWQKVGPYKEDVLLSYQIISPEYVQVIDEQSFLLNPYTLERDTVYSQLTALSRIYPVVFPQTIWRIDSISVEIPESFEVKSMPNDIELPSFAGRFSAKLTTSGNNIALEKSFSLDKTRVPPKNYESLRLLFADIHKQESQSILIVKR